MIGYVFALLLFVLIRYLAAGAVGTVEKCSLFFHGFHSPVLR